MPKKKYKKGKGIASGMGSFMKGGLGLYGGAMAVGSMPTLGIVNVETIKTNVGGGMASYSKAYPAVGSLMGTGMVLQATKKLTKKTKKLL